MAKAILIYNASLLDESMDTPGAVLVVDGKIRSVFQGFFTTAETVSQFAKAVLKEDGYGEDAQIELFDARGLTLTPAFIDMHVHMRYPGQTAKEDLNSGLHAAISGGFGTVVAMPNTNPVVSSIDMAMKIEREAAALGLTHLFQVVSITKDFDGNTTTHLDKLDKKYIPVISEDGRDVLSSAVMLEGMKKAASKGIIVSCHCEDPTLAATAKPYRTKALQIMRDNNIDLWGEPLDEDSDNEEWRYDVCENLAVANELLAEAEDIATARNISLAKEAGCHIHFAHVSTARSLEYIRKAKAEKQQKITCEVTPHHLMLDGDADKNYLFSLVNPPLRSSLDVGAVIRAITDGTADVISTDHAPHTMEDKQNGAPGFTGIETSYGVCNTVLVGNKFITPSRLSALMSANPARILGLQKGVLKIGFDADLTLVDPDEEWTVNPDEFYSKGKYTPIKEHKLQGRVKAVFIDGKLVFERH